MFERTFQPAEQSTGETYSVSQIPRAADHGTCAGATFDSRIDVSRHSDQAIDGAAAVLAEWYASHPVVRRLWAIDTDEALRVVLTLEPTADGDDTQPTWLAHSWRWARELRFRIPRMVHLELIADASLFKSSPDANGSLITEVSWRDPAGD